MDKDNRTIQEKLNNIQDEMKDINILLRVNNILLSRFILQLAQVRRDLGLPKRETFFRFEILEEEYKSLVNEFGKEETDKALYRLDRLLIQNKQNCPHNIRKYIRNRLLKRAKAKELSRLNNRDNEKK